jgi:proteasome assembly chaperone (PAC2) family protein
MKGLELSKLWGTGITLYKEPHVDKPYFIAAWLGMGNVALKAANFLREELKAEAFVEIEQYLHRIREEIQLERMLRKGEKGPEYVH